MDDDEYSTLRQTRPKLSSTSKKDQRGSFLLPTLLYSQCAGMLREGGVKIQNTVMHLETTARLVSKKSGAEKRMRMK